MTGQHEAISVWSPLARRMGYTREPAQRDEIVAARERMTCSAIDSSHPTALLVGAAVHAMLGVTSDRPSRGLQLIGAAQLDATRRLIGVEDRDGHRHYLLDLNVEAIHVLTEVRGAARPHAPKPHCGTWETGVTAGRPRRQRPRATDYVARGRWIDQILRSATSTPRG
jgi:hypothetical protein